MKKTRARFAAWAGPRVGAEPGRDRAGSRGRWAGRGGLRASARTRCWEAAVMVAPVVYLAAAALLVGLILFLTRRRGRAAAGRTCRGAGARGAASPGRRGLRMRRTPRRADGRPAPRPSSWRARRPARAPRGAAGEPPGQNLWAGCQCPHTFLPALQDSPASSLCSHPGTPDRQPRTV